MPFDRPTLEAAIQASGGAQQPDDQIDGLLAKLQVLETTGCVIQPNWTPNPPQTGHAFHAKLDT
ncbi:hypothetical protein ACFOFO_20785, partial [Undibacterium arcticum]